LTEADSALNELKMPFMGVLNSVFCWCICPSIWEAKVKQVFEIIKPFVLKLYSIYGSMVKI
ncbi:MAG: hypothetical protein ACRCSB_01515, partial [Bacteroidales bacterium]